MTYQANILFVDDEPAYRRSFQSTLRRWQEGLEVRTAGDGLEALEVLESYPADIVFTDFRMPKMDGLTLLTRIREEYPDVFVLMLTGVDSTKDVVAAMKAGAYDYILKPFDFEMVRKSIEKILEHKRILSEEQGGGVEVSFENIIGQDQKMFEIYEKISQVAQTNASVLITGESGTGKELIAEAIHKKSPRSNKPFVQVNCAALTETLINSELFGHEKGAFTGAAARKKGFFEQADGGTIFLDEIGDVPLQTQVALLRVLELGTFQRVGGTETIRVDVRLVCATNKDLVRSIAEKTFREDLYYRINVVSLASPSLSERKSDIPLLSKYFLEKYSLNTGKKVKRISKAATKLLNSYAWPGNVRELGNAIEHAVVFCKGVEMLPSHLPIEIREMENDQGDFNLSLSSSSLADAEIALISKVLEETDWNLKKAADALAIARGTLYSKMKKYNIKKPNEHI
ncbi:MAG: sigma-54-dependent Fis family transcriptional regulator [Desulfuromonas sp.]|nr:MAG: sigma-54-dependent Fis family transcriptional regulator [Desulfuromonas sp.]